MSLPTFSSVLCQRETAFDVPVVKHAQIYNHNC